MKQRKLPVGGGLLAGLLLASTGVGAETDAPAPEQDRERVTSLQEIIVTASRREINLQDLSMSVRALTQRQLEEVGAFDFYDYALLVPGLDYGTVGPGESRIIIRGVASNTGASTVGLYLDDLPVQSQGRNPEAQLFDVERVEVLRGPQGTLYGEGAMGGAIRVITNKADPNIFDASTEISVFTIKNSDTSYALNGMVNIPLIEDKLGLRVVGYHRDEDGYIDNIALGRDGVNTNKTQGGRASLRLLASERLDVTGLVSYSKLETGGLFGITLGLDDLQQSRQVREPLKDEFYQYGLTFNYDLGWADLTSVSSWFTRDAFLVRNVGGEARMMAEPEDDVIAQELRLVSTTDQPLQWIGGFFYKRAKYDQVANVIDPGFPEFLGGPNLIQNTSSSRNEQIAVFGEVSYRFTDRLEGTLGLRLFREELEGRGETSGIPLLLPEGPVRTFNEGSDNVATPKFALSYDVSDDAMLYAIVAKGYRQGGFNPPGELTGGAPETFSPDVVWNYELGAKTAWLDGRLIANAAVYYVDWKDLQSIPFFREFEFRYVDNVGEAYSTGGELEVIAEPFPGLQLTASGNITNAKLDEDTDGAPAGVRLPRVPRSTFALSASYRWDVTQGLRGMAHAGFQQVGKSYSQLDNHPLSEAPRYETSDLRVGIEAERWEVYAFAKNLRDKRAVTQSDLLSSGSLTILQPRTVGLTLRARM